MLTLMPIHVSNVWPYAVIVDQILEKPYRNWSGFQTRLITCTFMHDVCE